MTNSKYYHKSVIFGNIEFKIVFRLDSDGTLSYAIVNFSNPANNTIAYFGEILNFTTGNLRVNYEEAVRAMDSAVVYSVNHAPPYIVTDYKPNFAVRISVNLSKDGYRYTRFNVKSREIKLSLPIYNKAKLRTNLHREYLVLLLNHQINECREKQTDEIIAEYKSDAESARESMRLLSEECNELRRQIDYLTTELNMLKNN